MTSGQTLFITALFVAVLVFAFFMFRWALRRRAQVTGRLASLSAMPASPWRRFARALGAMYLLAPPAMRSGAPDNDPVFFGLGAHRSATPVEPQLREDWGVVDTASATRAVAAGWAFAADRVGRAGDVGAVHLNDAAQVLRAWGAPESFVQELIEAWGRREAGASFEQAYGASLPESAERAASQSGPAGIAFDIARHVHVARMATQAGWLAPEQEEQWGDRFGLLAMLAFSGWDRYADDFEGGMRAFRGNGLTGALYDKSVENGLRWLREDPRSPWKRVQWPTTATANAGSAATRGTPGTTGTQPSNMAAADRP